MKLMVFAVAAAAALYVSVIPASAHHEVTIADRIIWAKPLGPIGLSGMPPSNRCRKSEGGPNNIHCLHNLVWHGGKIYYIDDSVPERPILYRDSLNDEGEVLTLDR